MRTMLKHMPYKHILTVIRGEHWRHVRRELSPAFSSSKIKRLVPNITRLLPKLNDVIHSLAERGEEVELKEYVSLNLGVPITAFFVPCNVRLRPKQRSASLGLPPRDRVMSFRAKKGR